MRTIILCATVTVFFTAVTVCAQTPKQLPGPEIKQKATQRASYVTGVVSDWIMNVKEYVYDGFYFQTESEKYIVTFPTAIVNELRKDVKVGNTISVKGIRGDDTLGLKRINLISVTVDGQTTPNNPAAVSDSLVTTELVNGKAKIKDFQKNVDGKISGYVLDNKTILRVSPNTSKELEKLLVKGVDVSYSGIKSDSGSGEDAWSTYAVIQCQTIAVNGKQYLTK